MTRLPHSCPTEGERPLSRQAQMIEAIWDTGRAESDRRYAANEIAPPA
jgi:hypothetical protein